MAIIGFLSQFGWFYAFLAALFAALGLLAPTKRLIKWWCSPRLSARFAYPADPPDCVKDYQTAKNEDDTAIVDPEEPLRLGVSIDTDWIYTPEIIEIRAGSECEIKWDSYFVEDARPWENPYPGSDLHGDLKIQVEGITLKPRGTMTPLLVDFQIDPTITKGEKRRLIIHIQTKESKKAFQQEFWIEGR